MSEITPPPVSNYPRGSELAAGSADQFEAAVKTYLRVNWSFLVALILGLIAIYSYVSLSPAVGISLALILYLAVIFLVTRIMRVYMRTQTPNKFVAIALGIVFVLSPLIGAIVIQMLMLSDMERSGLKSGFLKPITKKRMLEKLRELREAEGRHPSEFKLWQDQPDA